MKNRYRKLRLVVMATASVVATSFLVSAAPTGATAATTCTPVQILAFRGSGETAASTSYSGTTVKTNGWEGKTLSRTIQSYVTQSRGTSAPNPRVNDVPIIAVGPNQFGTGKGYPAVAVPKSADIAASKKTLGDSARAGAVSTADYIDKTVASQTAAGCPSPKFVVLGYSQGAIAARWLAQLRPKQVALSEIFGDPLQFQNQTGNHGTGAGGNGFLRYVSTDAEKRTDNGYYSLSGPTKSAVCHTGDPICDYNWLLVGVLALALHQTAQHENYLVASAEASQEGQTISRKVAELLAAADRAKPGAAATSADPETNYVDDIDVESLMTGETPVVNADDPQSYLAPLAAEAPGSTAAPAAPQVGGLAAEPTTLTVHNGDAVLVRAGDIPAGTQYGFRLTPQTTEGSWRLPAVLTSWIQTSTGGPQLVPITIHGLEPGTYTGGILTGTFTHTPDITIVVVP